jgi:hypothetical protein
MYDQGGFRRVRLFVGGCCGFECEWERFLDPWDVDGGLVEAGGSAGEAISMGSDAIFGSFGGDWMLESLFLLQLMAKFY